MGQYRNDDHREDAPHFSEVKLLWRKVLNIVLKFRQSFQGLDSKAISNLPSDAFSFYPKCKEALLNLQYFCNFSANQNPDYPKDDKSKHFQVYSKLTSKSVFDFFEIFGWFDEDIFRFLSCIICFALIGWSSSESVCSPRNPVQSSSLSDILKRYNFNSCTKNCISNDIFNNNIFVLFKLDVWTDCLEARTYSRYV